MFALAEHINSNFAKNRVRQAGHRNAQCKDASSVGEGTPGRATMHGKGGQAVRLSVAVRFCRLVSFFSLKGLDRQGSQCPI